MLLLFQLIKAYKYEVPTVMWFISNSQLGKNWEGTISINMKPFHLSKHFHGYNKLNIILYLDMDKQQITTTSNLPVKGKVVLQV